MNQQMWEQAMTDTNVAYNFSQLSDDDLHMILNIARNFVQEHWRDAHLVYQDCGNGKPSHAAIGIAKPFYDNYGQVSKKQHALHLITPWLGFSTVELQHRVTVELWVAAYAYLRDYRARREPTFPQFDYEAQRRLILTEDQRVKEAIQEISKVQ